MRELERQQKDIATWSDQTFGAKRSPDMPIYHLLKEVKELRNALKEDPSGQNTRLEHADCFMLLLDSYRMAGGGAEDLVAAAFQKLAINKLRSWGEPDEDGVVEHIREVPHD